MLHLKLTVLVDTPFFPMDNVSRPRFAESGALDRTKVLLNESINRQLLVQLNAEKENFLQCADDTEFAIGLRGFMDRSTPQFSADNLPA